MVQERKGKLGIYCNKLQEDMNSYNNIWMFSKNKIDFFNLFGFSTSKKNPTPAQPRNKRLIETSFKQLLILIEKCHPYDAKSCNAIISTTLQPWIGFYLESVSIFGPHYEATTYLETKLLCALNMIMLNTILIH